MPASFCGIVGLKPTWGLVPYTGILGLDATIDHVGPMASTVRDCALLLEVIAGVDGLDDRQQFASSHGQMRYVEELDRSLRIADSAMLLRGLRVGILQEGFGLTCSDPNVDKIVLEAAEKFGALGATVRSVSLPMHSQGQKIWGLSSFMGSFRQSAMGGAQGRKQVYMTDRIERCQVGQEEFDCANVGARNMMLSGLYLEKHYGPGLYARCRNLLRKLNVRDLATLAK